MNKIVLSLFRAALVSIGFLGVPVHAEEIREVPGYWVVTIDGKEYRVPRERDRESALIAIRQEHTGVKSFVSIPPVPAPIVVQPKVVESVPKPSAVASVPTRTGKRVIQNGLTYDVMSDGSYVLCKT